MGDKPSTELLHSAVLGALGFPLGQVLAQAVGDVGTDERLVSPKAEAMERLP